MLCLGGTPLNGSLLAINTFVPEFKAKNNVQIVNLIYLTDGDSAGGEYVWNSKTVDKKNYSGETVMVREEIRNLNAGVSWRRSASKQKIFIRDSKNLVSQYRNGDVLWEYHSREKFDGATVLDSGQMVGIFSNKAYRSKR